MLNQHQWKITAKQNTDYHDQMNTEWEEATISTVSMARTTNGAISHINGTTILNIIFRIGEMDLVNIIRISAYRP